MTKSAKGFLPKIEIILIGVFFLVFLIWSVSKCTSRVDDNNDQMSAIDSTLVDTVAVEAEPSTGNPAAPVIQTEEVTKLYVLVNGLKFREEPNVKSKVILELNRGDKVQFMEEVTSFQDTFNLGTGNELAAPWVKIRHVKGREGWVFGGGVHYYLR